MCYCDLQGECKKVTARVTFVSISAMSADFCMNLYTSVKNKNALVVKRGCNQFIPKFFNLVISAIKTIVKWNTHEDDWADVTAPSPMIL